MIVCLYFFDLRALGILIISEAQVKDDSNLTQRGGGASPHSPTSELRRTRDVTYRVLSLSHGFRNVNESTGGWLGMTQLSSQIRDLSFRFFISEMLLTGGRKTIRWLTVLQITFCTYKMRRSLHPFDFPFLLFDNPFFHLGLGLSVHEYIEKSWDENMRPVL